MAEFDVIPLLMLLAGTCLFMVAAFAVCFALMIFCDILNLGGIFEKPAETVIAAVFAPIFLIGRLYDLVAVSFMRQDIQQSLRPPVVSKDNRTITV